MYGTDCKRGQPLSRYIIHSINGPSTLRVFIKGHKSVITRSDVHCQLSQHCLRRPILYPVQFILFLRYRYHQVASCSCCYYTKLVQYAVEVHRFHYSLHCGSTDRSMHSNVLLQRNYSDTKYMLQTLRAWSVREVQQMGRGRKVEPWRFNPM